ncbi:MAG: protealysin inhibitor emfourin [Actinomycetota bacterium]
MRVTVERSGGFAGITTTSSVDEHELTPDQARTMGELVQALDRVEQPAGSESRHRDSFEYAVTVETGDASRTISVGEDEASEQLRRLIEWVMSTADRSG